MKEIIDAMGKQIENEVISLRRALHKLAEPSGAEYKTAEYIARFLLDLGLSPRTGVAETGVVAFIDAGKENTLLLRADMDALPITEDESCPFASENPGMMHACGHDAHMAILLATVKCLVSQKEKLKTNVLLVFQPAEEDEGGAKPMIETGILEEFHVTCAAGLHVMNHLEAGTVSVRKGGLMASPDDFDLEIIGKGGHGAYPTECISPIAVQAQIVPALEEIQNNHPCPDEPCVISVCAINGGNTYNAIPDLVSLKGTVRTYDETLRNRLPELMEEAIATCCKRFGASYRFQFNFRYPPLVNNGQMVDTLVAALKNVLGEECVLDETTRSMAGEDFAYFAKAVPSVYFFLGAGNKESGITMPLHSTDFQIDERCLKTGVMSLLSLVFSDCIYF